MLKRWIAAKKVKLLHKWAQELGLYIVQIRNVSGTEYLVDKDGAFRKLVRRK